MSHRTGQVPETPAHGVAMSADHPARTSFPRRGAGRVPPDVDAIFKKRRGIVAGQHRKSHMASPLLPAVSFRFKTKLQEKNRIASGLPS